MLLSQMTAVPALERFNGGRWGLLELARGARAGRGAADAGWAEVDAVGDMLGDEDVEAD